MNWSFRLIRKNCSQLQNTYLYKYKVSSSGGTGGKLPPPKNFIKHQNNNHNKSPNQTTSICFDQKLPKEILLKIRPKELSVLNTPTHLSHFHGPQIFVPR